MDARAAAAFEAVPRHCCVPAALADRAYQDNPLRVSALNFNISVAIYALALVLLMIVTFGIGALIAVPGLIALGIFHLVFAIIAAIKANAGIFYRYPLTLRLVK